MLSSNTLFGYDLLDLPPDEKLSDEDSKTRAAQETVMQCALASRKIPTNRFISNVLKEPARLQAEAKKQIMARKLWTDVVSTTYQQNQAYIKHHNIKRRIIGRLKKIAPTADLEKLYKDCLDYLHEDHVITVTFSASFLQDSALTDFQLLNMWEKDNRQTGSYIRNRQNTEQGLFDFLPSDLKTKFFANNNALPRYGALLLLENPEMPIRGTSNYGSSFIVLKDVVKQNTLFVPGDSMMHHLYDRSGNYNLCTIHHLEFLLWQFPETTLNAIVQRIQTGAFPPSYDQNHCHTTRNKKGGYIEVLLPAIDIFNPDLVKHIHIDSGDYQLKPEEKAAIEQRGISVSNSFKAANVSAEERFLENIRNNNEAEVKKLLERYPNLIENIYKSNEFTTQENIILKFFTNNPRLCPSLLNESANQRLIHTAVRNNDLEAVKFLLAGYLNNHETHGEMYARILKKALKPMANDYNYENVAHEIAKAYLKIYIYNTGQRPCGHYKTVIPFFNISLGYSSTQKLIASRILDDQVAGKNYVDISHYQGELSNGDLGLIRRNLKL